MNTRDIGLHLSIWARRTKRNGLIQTKEALQHLRNQRGEVAGWRSFLQKKEALQHLRNQKVEVAGQRSSIQKKEALHPQKNQGVEEVAGRGSILLKKEALQPPRNQRAEVAGQWSIPQKKETLNLPWNSRAEVAGWLITLENSLLPSPIGPVGGLRRHHLLETLICMRVVVEVELQVGVLKLLMGGWVNNLQPHIPKGQLMLSIIDIRHQGLATPVMMDIGEVIRHQGLATLVVKDIGEVIGGSFCPRFLYNSICKLVKWHLLASFFKLITFNFHSIQLSQVFQFGPPYRKLWAYTIFIF